MLNLNWMSAFGGLFGFRGSKGAKRVVRKSVFSRVENLEDRALLSAVSIDVSPRELRMQERAEARAEAEGRKRAPVKNPGGVDISFTYPDLSIDVQEGDWVHLATINVRSNGRKDLYFSGTTAEGSNLDEVFANLRINDVKEVTVNSDKANITDFNALIKRKQTFAKFEVWGQAKAHLPDGITETDFSLMNGQVRYLKPRWPGFVHLSSGSQSIPQIRAHGAPIVNPDPAGFTVFPVDQNVEEGTSSSVGVVLDAQPTSNVTLNFSLTPGPISLSSSTVTFTPQNWNIPQYVTLNAPENAVDQPDQTQTLTVGVNDALSDNAFDPLADEVFMYGFSDNDPTVNPVAGDFSFSLTPTSISEAAGTTTATITLNSTFTSNVSIQVSTLSSALTGGGTLTFAPGETVKTITFASVNNTTDEADRTVTITATVLAGSDSRFQVGLNKSATVTVIDDDPTVNPVQGDFTISANPTSISENGGQTTVTITLNSTFANAVTIQVYDASDAVTGGAALTFAPGETTKTVTFTGVNNSVDEADRVVTITATVLAGSDSRFTAGLSKTATVTVIDDDPTVNPVQGDFSLNLTPTSISEVAGTTTATITLNSTFTSSVSIQVSTLSSALTGGGTLTFAPGETVKTVTFASVNNSVDEADRQATITATVLAGSDSRFTAGLSKSGVVTVIDDDPTVDPNPQGSEISRFITYLGTTSGILKVKSFTFATNVTSLTHTQAAFDFDGNGDVGSSASEYLATTVSAVTNGQVTITFDLEIGPGSYGFQIRSRHPGIQNATFTPVSALVETLDGQTKVVTFTQNEAGGPWFYDTTIAA